jgi:hypothetical protein
VGNLRRIGDVHPANGFRGMEEVLVTNSRIHAGVALGSVFIAGVMISFLPPVAPASAQSQAQRICREQGIKPGMAAYEYCLAQATRALEWGEPQLAYTFAQVSAEALNACLSYGLHEGSSGLQSCVDKEATSRALMVLTNEEPSYGPQVANHP